MTDQTKRAPSVTVLQRQMAKHREQLIHLSAALTVLAADVNAAQQETEERLQKLNAAAEALQP